LSLNGFFNQRFNDNLKQYRCIAIKNENATDTALNAAVYIKQNTVNASSLIKIALEMPTNDYRSGTISSGSTISVVDPSLVGVFSDNHFQNAVLRITGGSNVNQSRIISSYDDSTGTFVLQSSLPFGVSSGDSYEVDAGFRDRFLASNAANDRFFAAGKPDHFRFDIEEYVAARLQAAGVGKVEKLGLDTYTHEDRYYSYRRSCHRGEAGYGRQISLIGLKGTNNER